jgi:hypothetical protein
MPNKPVVSATFKDEASADAAAAFLEDSGAAHHDAIGVLVPNEKGETKVEKVGKRSMGRSHQRPETISRELARPIWMAALVTAIVTKTSAGPDMMMSMAGE